MKRKKKAKIYENYPWGMVIVAIILMLAVWVAGIYITFTLSLITGLLYVIFLLVVEFSLYKEGCRHCYYYDKRCAFGRSYIARIFFKKGDPKKFCEKEITFKDFIPQILGTAIPLVIGILLLISRGFNIWILIATIYPVLNWFIVNPSLYGKLACAHCKQGSICCPALKFFDKM